jgi:hypothetical protein
MKLPVLFVVLTLYIAIVALLLYTKPSLMFDNDGKPKPFGVGFAQGRSVFAPSVMFPLIALILYIMIAWARLLT